MKYFQTFFVHVKAKDIFIHPNYSGYHECQRVKKCEDELKEIGNNDLCMIRTYLGSGLHGRFLATVYF